MPQLNLSNILTILVLVVTAWNAYQHTTMKNVILELQLNLKREFNGRYQSLEVAKQVEERLERVEDKVFK